MGTDTFDPIERAEYRGDESEPFVRGSAHFLADLSAGLGLKPLHASFLRSPIASGRVIRLETDNAYAAPGVVKVFDNESLGCEPMPGALRPGVPPAIGMERPILAAGVVRHVGDPVAMVVAKTVAASVDGMELIDVDYEEFLAVIDLDQAILDSTVIFPEAGTNVVARIHAGDDRGNNEGMYDVNASIEVYNQRLAANPIETLGVLAVPEGDGRLTVWCGHQAPHRLRAQIARFMNLEEAKVQVRVPDTGGAFGLRGALYPEYMAAIKSSLTLDQPVMWRQLRREHMQSGTHGRGQRHKIQVSGDLSGKVRRLDIDVVADLGAYPQSGSFVISTTSLCAQGPYDIGQVSFDAALVVTNQAPIGPYRGAGRPEATFALECAMDEFARAAGLDPIEVRRMNLVSTGQMPFETRTGAIYDGGDYAAALDRLVELLDVPGVRKEQQSRTGDGPLIGCGISVFLESAGAQIGAGEFGRIEIRPDGTILVQSGGIATGQGHARVFRKLVSTSLPIAPDRILVVEGDTDRVDRSTGTFGSRTMQTAAVALHQASLRLVERARNEAAQILEVSPDDLEAGEGHFRVSGDPASAVPYGLLAEVVASRGETLAEEEWFVLNAQAFPYGAHGAIVEVDPETGAISVRKIVAVDDSGVPLDHESVEGQITGAIAQGLGQAIYEGIVYDESGQLLTGSLGEYLLPTATDMPPLQLDLIETPSSVNSLGVRGVGEAACVGIPPAIVAAVADALGCRMADLQMPMRSEVVWKALAATGVR